MSGHTPATLSPVVADTDLGILEELVRFLDAIEDSFLTPEVIEKLKAGEPIRILDRGIQTFFLSPLRRQNIPELLEWCLKEGRFPCWLALRDYLDD